MEPKDTLTAYIGYLGVLGIEVDKYIMDELNIAPIQTFTCDVRYETVPDTYIKYIKITSPSGGYCIIHRDELLAIIPKNDIEDKLLRMFIKDMGVFTNARTVLFTYDEMKTLMQFAWYTGGIVQNGEGVQIKNNNNNA